MNALRPVAVDTGKIAGRVGSGYPDPYKQEVATRRKKVLGDLFDLTQFGVNLVELPPGSWSAQRHWHTHEDEFIYVVAGELTLVTDAGEQPLCSGMVAGFPGGGSNGHHLRNTGVSAAIYLEIGSRLAKDEVYYPDIDLQLVSDGSDRREFTHRDGTPYAEG